jgi:hypothetical protein
MAIVRLPTVKQSLNTLPKSDTNAVRRSRRFSLTGSHAKKAAAAARSVSRTTLEAKLIAGM